MATTTTANTFVGPQDGWVSVAVTAATFIRVSGYPHTHPYQLFFGASAPSLAAVQGSGTATFSTGNPAAGGTITIGTEVYTFRAAATLPFEVTIGADFHATATAFTAIVNAQSQLVTAVDAADVVTLTSKLAGTLGNYALSKTATNVAVSGAVFTGGLEIPQGVTVCHKPFVLNNGTTAQPLFARVVNPVPNSKRSDGRLRLDVVVVT